MGEGKINSLLEPCFFLHFRLTWADIDLGGGTGFTSMSGTRAPVNLGRQSVVVRVWFTPLPGSAEQQNVRNNTVFISLSFSTSKGTIICPHTEILPGKDTHISCD